MLHPYHSYGCKDRNRDSSERRKGSGNESIWNQIVTCRHEPGRRWEGWTAEMKGMRSARPRTWQTRCGPGPGFDHSRHGRSTRDSLQPLRTILHVLRLISSDLSATAAPILLKDLSDKKSMEGESREEQRKGRRGGAITIELS